MAVTLKEVAEQAGVSRSAVSRTFTEGASVSEKTRHKVLTAAESLGYHPNALASSLTTGRTKLIGLVSNNFHNPLFLEVFDLFTKGLQDQGLRPLLVNLSDETSPDNSVRMLLQYSVDGVIVSSSALPASFAKAFRDAGLPVVHAFGRPSGTPDVHVVGIDNVECGRMAARALVERGYRRVGFLGGPKSAPSTQDRLRGFLDELSHNPHIETSSTFAAAYSFDAGREEMMRVLKNAPAEAYFCGDDVISIGAMAAARMVGMSIPEDIGFIGLNDMQMARWEGINLTTIHHPIRQIVASSVDLVTTMLDDPTHKPEARRVPCHLVERGTLRQIPG